MSCVAVTGATGFIGQEVSALFRRQGADVIELSRSGGKGGSMRWALGQDLPEACRTAETIVHLASATLSETGSLQAAIDRDVDGTRVILRQVRTWRQAGGRHRFIFVSSQSAKPDAANAYGRSKWAIEQLLDHDDDIVVRPGLVYSEMPSSVFATFDKLSRMPILPVINHRPVIQPIHVREVARCIAELARMDQPPRMVKIGAAQPLTFRDAMRATARRAGRRAPLMVPIPMRPVKLMARLVDRLFHLTITERLDGLAGLQPLETKASLAALGQALDPY